MALEYQRYGRNKGTLVNKAYIESGEYRRKFDGLSDNQEVNKALYNAAKTALKHRSGTELEDMYWIDGETGAIIYSALDSTEEQAIEYTAAIKRALSKNKDKEIIALHTHPHSMPPSIEDLNSCYRNGYVCGYVACHNGKIFRYSSNERVNPQLYDMYIQRFMGGGLNEYDAQKKALQTLMKGHSIDFKEVL